MIIDPVCGMEIEEEQALATTDHKGQTYYFCSTSCQHLFEQNPQHYTDQQDDAKKATHA